MVIHPEMCACEPTIIPRYRHSAWVPHNVWIVLKLMLHLQPSVQLNSLTREGKDQTRTHISLWPASCTVAAVGTPALEICGKD